MPSPTEFLAPRLAAADAERKEIALAKRRATLAMKKELAAADRASWPGCLPDLLDALLRGSALKARFGVADDPGSGQMRVQLQRHRRQVVRMRISGRFRQEPLPTIVQMINQIASLARDHENHLWGERGDDFRYFPEWFTYQRLYLSRVLRFEVDSASPELLCPECFQRTNTAQDRVFQTLKSDDSLTVNALRPITRVVCGHCDGMWDSPASHRRQLADSVFTRIILIAKSNKPHQLLVEPR